MHADHAFGIDLGRKKVGEISSILNVGAYQLLQSKIGIAHAMSNHAQFGQGYSGLDQKLIQFGGTFVIAPIADPDHINLFAALKRMELLDVSGLMKSPRTIHAETIDIDAPDSLAKGQDPIHQMQMEFQDFAGAGVGA